MGVKGVGGGAGHHERPADRMKFGGHKGHDLRLVDLATGEPADVSGVGICQKPRVDASEEMERGVGSEHVFGGVGALGHLVGDGDGHALGEPEGAWGVAEHVELAVVDEEIGAEEAVDEPGEFVEGLTVDIVLDFGNTGFGGKAVERGDQLRIAWAVAGFVGEDGPDAGTVGILGEIEELVFYHIYTVTVFYQLYQSEDPLLCRS